MPPSGPAPERTSRGWALAGVGAGLAGMASIYLSLTVSPAYDPAAPPTPESITAHLSTMVPQLLGFHVATIVAGLALIPFAVGLHRHLTRRTPAGSLLPGVAAVGLVVLSAVLVLGSGLDTEFVFGLTEPELLVATDVSFYSHWVATIPWLWVTAGVSGLALGLAAIRHGAFGRVVGLVSVVLGALIVLVGVSPLQYMAGFVGPIWLLVVGLAALRAQSRPEFASAGR
ncbi:hypothetical protein EXU48_03150 [Occultella glacieicola]|uniref:DUF4386 domain-containing protein n=1 Tax=Occultella glacieicola TaxID=2518684 RepID=A0ABY2E952_9MICO|nr:hypothetical protein EXU48_03150 [Occultella glacieicola]